MSEPTWTPRVGERVALPDQYSDRCDGTGVVVRAAQTTNWWWVRLGGLEAGHPFALMPFLMSELEPRPAAVELAEARAAVGEAWFVGNVTLAEAVRRKCASLEALGRGARKASADAMRARLRRAGGAWRVEVNHG